MIELRNEINIGILGLLIIAGFIELQGDNAFLRLMVCGVKFINKITSCRVMLIHKHGVEDFLSRLIHLQTFATTTFSGETRDSQPDICLVVQRAILEGRYIKGFIDDTRNYINKENNELYELRSHLNSQKFEQVDSANTCLIKMTGALGTLQLYLGNLISLEGKVEQLKSSSVRQAELYKIKLLIMDACRESRIALSDIRTSSVTFAGIIKAEIESLKAKVQYLNRVGNEEEVFKANLLSWL